MPPGLPQQPGPAHAAPGAPGFDTALQAITARIGATADGVVHNKANRLLADGCGRLGYPWKTIPQNLADGGKGIANGMPIGMLVGPEKYMSGFEEVFLSSTYGGETTALAAAVAGLKYHREHDLY